LCPFFHTAFFKLISIGIHLAMGLRHHEGFLFSIGHNRKLDSFFPESSLLTVIGDNGCYCGGGALVSKDVFGFL
jgi:hypothetical protein